MSTAEEKVERLESILGQFIVHTDVVLRRLENDTKAMNNPMAETAGYQKSPLP